MPMMFGLNGKERALRASLGLSNPNYGTLYLGLLSTYPSNADNLTLGSLVTNEFAVNPNFYTGRQPIDFDINISTDYAEAANNNVMPIEWVNTSGATITIPGMFITNASSGSTGQVLWVGTPTVGSSSIQNTKKASIYIETMTLRVS